MWSARTVGCPRAFAAATPRAVVTIFRNDENSNFFDGKDARILVIDVSPNGKEKTIAKTLFDLSQYAGVPSASATKIVQISNKISMPATLDSR
jgi:hypothetical protein